MKTIANSLSVDYDLVGPEDAPVFMFSHALAANKDMWAPQAAALAGRYRVLRYDIRGHGGSQVPPGPYTFGQLVEDVRALLDAEGVRRVHFVGLSMGGMIGQWLALAYPERLLSLVVCDTSARTPPEAGSMWDERIAVAEEEGMEPHVKPTLDRWFTPGFAARHPEIVEPVGRMIRTTDPRGYVACAQAVRNHNALGRLGEIAMPTLVIVGKEDPGAPVEAAEAIHRAIRGSEFVVLKSASHLSNLEQVEAFNRVLLDFVARVGGP
jgi:3-oxoadipate enol-lactonase